MFARTIAIPVFLVALIFLYLSWEVDEKYALYIVPPVVLLAAIYILSPQINWWWHQRRPPKLDPMVETLLGRYLKFYQNLSLSEKKRFRDRVALYLLSKEFMPQGMEAVPNDVKGLIAACPVWLTFGYEEFLLPKFERIVVYPHPFPSPQYPEHLHASEIFEEDGVIIFSLEHFMPGFLEPSRYYDIGLHEYARIFVRSHPHKHFPVFGDELWGKLPYISGMTREAIAGWIGLPEVESLPVAIVHFFRFPDRFRAQLPKAYLSLCAIFRQEPATVASSPEPTFSAN
jgi:hypothetical protein